MKNINFYTLTQNESPIFIFASGHRCGSTLLQRILNSNPNILIWGEQNGLLSYFIDSNIMLREWESSVSESRKVFLNSGYDNFSANMMPEDYEIRDSAIAYISTLFGIPASKQNRSIWGFKEVRYGMKIAMFLQECFPKARFIHLTRNLEDCFLSMKRWEVDAQNAWNRNWTLQSIEKWEIINRSFLEYKDALSKIITVRYEDMIADRDQFLHLLEDFLDLPQNSFDSEVFEKKLRTIGNKENTNLPKSSFSFLTSEEMALISTQEIMEVKSYFGYE